MNILSKRNLITALACACLIFGKAYAEKSTNNNFSSEDQRISFWAPSPPIKTEDLIPSKTGTPYKRTTYAVEGANYIFLAGILDFRKDSLPTTGNEILYLDSMLESIQMGLGADFVLDSTGGLTDIYLPGTSLKGRQLKGTIKGQLFVMRAYVATRAIYMQQITFPIIDKKVSQTAEHFLNSLVIKPGDTE